MAQAIDLKKAWKNYSRKLDLRFEKSNKAVKNNLKETILLIEKKIDYRIGFQKCLFLSF